MCHELPKLPALICPQPTKQRDQIPLFLRNTLTLAPRSNLARYNKQPRRHFSWLNASQALMGFPRQTAKGDISHGLMPAKLSWGSRDKQPKATFLMAQRQPSSHGFPETNSQRRHFSWLNGQPSSHGFPETNSQRRHFSWLNARLSSHGFPETNSQRRHFSWLNARLSSHGLPETNSQRRHFSWLNASQALMGLPERNSQRRHFSWLNARLSSHGFPERNSQRRHFSWLNASQALMGFPRNEASLENPGSMKRFFCKSRMERRVVHRSE